MQGIGDTLREARMRQRIDISEVEAKTKIRAKYLRALENEEFDLLPGSTFVRSFLRTYAEFLGLDAHMLVEEYRARHEPRGESDLLPIAADTRRRERRAAGGGGPGLGAALAVAAAAVLAILLVIGLVSGSGSDDGGKGAAPGAQQQGQGSARGDGRGSQAGARAKPRRVTLRISPVEATYVCVDRGEGAPLVFEGTIGVPRSWRGRHLRLNLGRTSATVTVNGERLSIPQGPSPVGYDITPKETKPLPPGRRPCG
ncbi:MAG: helix-turn-helix domain-containing protein [Thermoleophilaceae bacterium]|nr:helix-turn-helix domain-containing protein [Thermoleophilaceae bacterium]